MASSCPNEAELTALLTGKLPETEHLRLEHHLEECAPCRERLEVMAGGDGNWLGNARAYVKAGSTILLGEVVERLKSKPASTIEIKLPPLDPLPASGESVRCLGNYEILSELGRGGMGIVYEAEESESGRRVALKVLSHSLDSSEARRRFLREGRLAASLNHPNCVYVYGTEEIEGTPVITMELVTGGTLQKRIKQHGPLPITEAVDAILQVIAGLEAAQAKGVLHRDIKASNCFVERDGAIKVGDFGLSISTLARGQSILTVSGTFLGTPAYASPEQLRGDPLDVRSDIYAVGVTLYYLLTGKTPFEGDNLVKLLTTVLERPAESPKNRRPEIPKDLARGVLRCLAKKPAQRFENYGALREALLPFGSSASLPATLGLRSLAGSLDLFLCSLMANLPLNLIPALVNASSSNFLPQLVIAGTVLLYFSVAEAFWATSVGKKACRLRVTGLTGSPPGLARAVLRAVIFASLMYGLQLCFLATNLASNQRWFQPAIAMLSLAAIFSTARGNNGFAGLHDLASGTRVVSAPTQRRSTVVIADDARRPATENLAQIGPYHILATLSTTGTQELLLGYDTRLLRKVWVLKLAADAPPLARVRCELARPTRLRWLSGKRTEAACWDAFEAVPGRPLLQLLTEHQPWTAVRDWLHDLAEELGAGVRDKSLPAILGLDRIWITTEGRAKLLEFPAPGVPATETVATTQNSTSPPEHSEATALLFFKELARAALPSHAVKLDGVRSHSMSIPLPIPAQTFVTNHLERSTLETLAGELKRLLAAPPVVTGAQRRQGMQLGLLLVVSGFFVTGFPGDLSVLPGCSVLRGVSFLANSAWFQFVVLPSIIASALFRGGPLLHAMGIAVVTRDGSRASRLRAFGRASLTWSPVLIMPLAMTIVRAEDASRYFLLALLLIGAAVIAALWTPQRALQDRIAGTWLVPK